MQPRGYEVKGEDRQRLEESLDEGFPPLPLAGGCGPMDSVQELGGRDRGDADRLLALPGSRRVEVQDAPFDGNQDRRIDQRPHGVRGSSP